MQVEQNKWTPDQGWQFAPGHQKKAQLVLIFGERKMLQQENWLGELRAWYPEAQFVGCSTSGEILDSDVSESTIVTTALYFERTELRFHSVYAKDFDSSFEAGRNLAELFPPNGLNHVFVLAPGLGVNGSDFLRGMNSRIAPGCTISGGMAGDQDRFEETFVISDQKITNDLIVGIGFYGPHLKVVSASMGGWEGFGQTKTVTRSIENRLSEIDGRPALEVYRNLLGDHARNLPASALLFPLSLEKSGEEKSVVRTILSIDEFSKSLIFAGDVPQGSQVRFMRASVDRLVQGAEGAARAARKELDQVGFAILVSCVGRKLVMKDRTREEIQAVKDIVGRGVPVIGFYSYGEISPFSPGEPCELHNQTMTVTLFSETEE